PPKITGGPSRTGIETRVTPGKNARKKDRPLAPYLIKSRLPGGCVRSVPRGLSPQLGGYANRQCVWRIAPAKSRVRSQQSRRHPAPTGLRHRDMSRALLSHVHRGAEPSQV